MAHIATLEEIPYEQLYTVFRQAFEDYPVSWDHAQLEATLKRRGFDARLSYGVFDEGQLVSFLFNGIGHHQGIPTAYDTGTGTLREYRGQGWVSKMFDHAFLLCGWWHSSGSTPSHGWWHTCHLEPVSPR